MPRLLLLLLVILTLPSCAGNREAVEEAEAKAKATAELKIRAEIEAKIRKEIAEDAGKSDKNIKTAAIAQNVADARPPLASAGMKGAANEAAAVNGNLDGILQAANIDPATLPPPRIDLAKWVADSRAALEASKTEQERLKATVAASDAARTAAERDAKTAEEKRVVAESRAVAAEANLRKVEEENGGIMAWLTKGGAVASILAVVGIAGRALNVPGVSLIVDQLQAMLLKPSLRKYERAAERGATAIAAVTASDVASQGLALLDQHLLKSNPEAAGALRSAVAALSGKPMGVQDFFVSLAQAHAVDTGKHPEVDDLLREIRREAPTTGGTYDALAAILAARTRLPA